MYTFRSMSLCITHYLLTYDRDTPATIDLRFRPPPRPCQRHCLRTRDRDLRANLTATHSPRCHPSAASTASAHDRRHLQTSQGHAATGSLRCATARSGAPHSRHPDATRNRDGLRCTPPRLSAAALARPSSSLAPSPFASLLRILLFSMCFVLLTASYTLVLLYVFVL